MERKNGASVRQEGEDGRHEHKLPREISSGERELARSAHDEAEHDMEEDPELSAQSPNDDLDEGESARLGEDGNALI